MLLFFIEHCSYRSTVSIFKIFHGHLVIVYQKLVSYLSIPLRLAISVLPHPYSGESIRLFHNFNLFLLVNYILRKKIFNDSKIFLVLKIYCQIVFQNDCTHLQHQPHGSCHSCLIF